MSACEVHMTHSPDPKRLNVHHVLPLSWGGPDEPWNKVTICMTGHGNVHSLLNEYVRAKGEPPWSVRIHWGDGERDLALRAWDAHTGPTPYTLEDL